MGNQATVDHCWIYEYSATSFGNLLIQWHMLTDRLAITKQAPVKARLYNLFFIDCQPTEG